MTIYADSGRQADIRAAVDRAVAGDTVRIPAGTWAFTGQVFAPDGIHIQGDGRDSTYLVKGDDLSEWQGMFTVDCKTGRPFVFSDMTLQGRLDALQGTNRTTVVTDVRDRGLYIKGAARNVQATGTPWDSYSSDKHPTIQAGKWYHLRFQMFGGSSGWSKIWVDGVLCHSRGPTPNNYKTDMVRIDLASFFGGGSACCAKWNCYARHANVHVFSG